MPPIALRCRHLLRPAAVLAVLLAAPLAQAQSFCSSDGQPRPLALVERFISADCASCWADPAAPKAQAREIAIDWILPGSKGEDAPLSAAARTESRTRLAALGRTAPAQMDDVRQPLVAAARTLRVAHGLPFNGYLGTSIALQPAGAAPWHAWLALVETIPAGTEGTPVERNLVRNLLQPPWDKHRTLSKNEQNKLLESRPMSIPEGADPQRLRLVGWVEDARGRIRAIAQSRCAEPAGTR